MNLHGRSFTGPDKQRPTASRKRIHIPLPDTEIRWLTTTTLKAEWEALLRKMRRIGRVGRGTAHIEPGGAAAFWIECDDAKLGALDRALMNSLSIEPQYRERFGHEHWVLITFRSWWRASVPFIIDPDGSKHHYRYEILEGEMPMEKDQG